MHLLVMADMLLTCLVKISALRFSYLYFLCFLTALDFALIKKRLSMLLILKNCGEESKIVRVAEALLGNDR